jgi:hypothetical protein
LRSGGTFHIGYGDVPCDAFLLLCIVSFFLYVSVIEMVADVIEKWWNFPYRLDWLRW